MFFLLILIRETLLMMRSASEFMTSTLNDVLSMQKIEEGRMELDMQTFNLSDALSSVMKTFRGAARGKGVQLTLTVSDYGGSVRLLGDRFKLEHSLANLVSNAIKFSPIGGTVGLSVTATGQVRLASPTDNISEDEWVTVVVDVRDDGPGISEENQKKLFGNFVQINAGKLQQGQGSGLGLFLCRQMTELQGGRLSVTSREGEGSTFRLSIPFLVVPALVAPSLSVSRGEKERRMLSRREESDSDEIKTIVKKDFVPCALVVDGMPLTICQNAYELNLLKSD